MAFASCVKYLGLKILTPYQGARTARRAQMGNEEEVHGSLVCSERADVDASRVAGEVVTAACTFCGRTSNISVSIEV
jgi:hypothetical protein